MKKFIFTAISAMALLTSCEKSDVRQRIFTGPVEKFQHGKAWTSYEIDDSNAPLRLSISIDDAAMNSLDRAVPHSGGHTHDNSVLLKFHPKALETVFNHVSLDWNPHGHEPQPIYGRAHFDFHFYSVTPAEVAAIPPYTVDPVKFDNWPAPAYFPPAYFNAGGGAPKMGAHWVDLTSPEFHGQPFTQTFIYGSYNGQVTFYEPMITEAFILANPSFERSIPQPAKVQKTGYYPTRLRMAKTNGVTHIILEGFVLRQAS